MNAPGNLERLRFLVKIVQRESLHLHATDERLFASPLTPERLQSMESDHAKAEQLDAFVARFARLQDTVGDKFVPTLLQALQEPIKPLRDGLRFLLIIFKIATLYSPLMLFVPASALFFVLGCVNCVWTFMHDGRLTNGITLIWSAAVIVFLIGLVSEQITALTYRRDA